MDGVLISRLVFGSFAVESRAFAAAVVAVEDEADGDDDEPFR